GHAGGDHRRRCRARAGGDRRDRRGGALRGRHRAAQAADRVCARQRGAGAGDLRRVPRDGDVRAGSDLRGPVDRGDYRRSPCRGRDFPLKSGLMAVPPIQRSPEAAPQRAGSAPMLDAVLGLLIVAALPLAIVAIPNTVSVVAGLLPDDLDRVALMRAHGLALPAMLLTVPLAVLALRRVKAAHRLVGGLALLAAADAAGGYAGSAFVVGVLRVAHGVGAGLLVPATLVAAWERPRWLRGLWAGVLALSMLSAQALALWPLAGATEWRVTLQPYPLLSGVALALAAVYFVLWLLRGGTSEPGLPPGGRVLLTVLPAAVVAVVAVGAASQDWGAGLMILLAAAAVIGLIAAASAGAAGSRTLAYTMVTVGVVLLPSVAQ